MATNHKNKPHLKRRGAGMTLVEVMMAFAVFAIAIVGALGAIIFSLNNIDSARTEAQVAQILVNEMETLRLREWGTSRLLQPTPPALASPDTNLINTIRTLAKNGDSVAPPAGLVAEALKKYQAGGTLVALPGSVSRTEFLPFSAYGAIPNSGRTMAQVGVDTSVKGAATYRARATGGYTSCERYIFEDINNTKAAGKDIAVIILLVKWTDRRGDHSRSLSTILVSNGLITQN